MAAALQARIRDGEFTPGSQLPTARALATEHAVAKNSANAALRLLRDEGLVVIRPGSGAYVADLVDPAEPTVLDQHELEHLHALVATARTALEEIERRLGRPAALALAAASGRAHAGEPVPGGSVPGSGGGADDSGGPDVDDDGDQPRAEGAEA